MTEYEAESIQNASHSNFQFSTSLQNNLPTNGNLVFSPLSLGLILLVARFGAGGQTATQLEQALKFPFPIEDEKADLKRIRLGFFKMLKKLKPEKDEAQTKDYTVTIATRVYLDESYKINKTFKYLSKRVLDIRTPQVNFTDGVKAAESINSWVKNETNDKVTQLFSAESFSSDTKIVLVNAIYFKCPWKYPFETTLKARFNVTKERSTEVDMMVLEDDFPSGDVQELKAKIVVLPYKGNRFSMQVLIPKQGQTLDQLLVDLNNTNMTAIRKNIRNAGNCDKIKLYFPKFTIESTLDLVQPLTKMGATDMFSESKADFSGIPLENETHPPKLFVSQVIQKAYIAVDENGTEAAAVSGIRAGVSCFPTVTEIKADQPFYYQIVEDETNAVLFAGVVRDPSVLGGIGSAKAFV